MARVWKYTIALLVAAAIVLPLAIKAEAVGVEAAVGMWMQSPSGSLQYQGTSNDLKDTLGMDDETGVYARARIEMPLVVPNVLLMYTPIKLAGTSSFNFDFGGVTFTPGASTEVQMTHYDFGLYYGIPGLKLATLDKLNVDVGIDARLIDFSASASSSGSYKEKSMTVPLPMLYVAAQFRPIDLVGIEAEGFGIGYSSNSYIDVTGRVKIYPIDNVFVAGGYRIESIKLDTNDVKADVSFSGPLAEAGIKF